MIRPAKACDSSRIAEIIITNYRVNFYPFFLNDDYYFSELNVVDMASQYAEGSEELKNTWVFDDCGVVKGIVRVKGDEIEKLFVEPQFQNMHIGQALLDYAVTELNASWLWVLEYNIRAKNFYKRNGFEPTGDKIIEDDWVPLTKLARKGE